MPPEQSDKVDERLFDGSASVPEGLGARIEDATTILTVPLRPDTVIRRLRNCWRCFLVLVPIPLVISFFFSHPAVWAAEVFCLAAFFVFFFMYCDSRRMSRVEIRPDSIRFGYETPSGKMVVWKTIRAEELKDPSEPKTIYTYLPRSYPNYFVALAFEFCDESKPYVWPFPPHSLEWVRERVRSVLEWQPTPSSQKPPETVASSCTPGFRTIALLNLLPLIGVILLGWDPMLIVVWLWLEIVVYSISLLLRLAAYGDGVLPPAFPMSLLLFFRFGKVIFWGYWYLGFIVLGLGGVVLQYAVESEAVFLSASAIESWQARDLLGALLGLFSSGAVWVMFLTLVFSFGRPFFQEYRRPEAPKNVRTVSVANGFPLELMKPLVPIPFLIVAAWAWDQGYGLTVTLSAVILVKTGIEIGYAKLKAHAQ